MQDIINFIINMNWLEMIGAANGLLLALIVVFQMIPGSQPESTLQKIVDFISKFSKK